MKVYKQPRTGVEYEMEEFRRLSQDMVRLSRNGFMVEVVVRDLLRWEMGAYAQDAFPYLDPDEREFLITGMTPAEFDAVFPEEEPDPRNAEGLYESLWEEEA